MGCGRSFYSGWLSLCWFTGRFLGTDFPDDCILNYVIFWFLGCSYWSGFSFSNCFRGSLIIITHHNSSWNEPHATDYFPDVPLHDCLEGR
jgi:hypothetical protein